MIDFGSPAGAAKAGGELLKRRLYDWPTDWFPWEKAISALPGLVHWWPLDEPSGTFNDRVGNWHGTANNTPSRAPRTTGIVLGSRARGAFSSRQSSRISFGSNSVAPPFTWMGWVRPGGVSNTALIGNWSGTTGGMIYASAIGDVVTIYAGATSRSSSTVLTSGVHFLVYTLSGTTGTLYIDGVLATQGALGTYGTPIRILECGNYNNSSGTYSMSEYAHLAIVNRAITAGEVQALWLAGRGNTSIVRDQLQLFPLRDTYMTDTSPNANSDNSATMLCATGTATFQRTSLMMFDGRLLRQLRRLNTVTLRLAVDSRNDGLGGYFQVRRILRQYDPFTVSWNSWKTGSGWTTAGARSEGNDYETGVFAWSLNSTGTSLTAVVTFDITNIVRRFLLTQDDHLRLAVVPFAANNGTIIFASIEGVPAKWPRLLIR